MSLINRMLRELSSREPRAGDVMSGIQLPPAARTRRAYGRRLVLLLVLVAAFTGVLWALFSREVTGPAPAEMAAAPPSPSTPAATAPLPDRSRFRLDDRLHLPESLPRNPYAGSPEPAAGAATADPEDRRLVAALTRNPLDHGAREQLVARRLDSGRLKDARRSLNRGLKLAADHVPYHRLDEQVRAAEQVAAARKPAAAPPAVASSSAIRAVGARDQREAEARHTEAARALQRGEPKTAELGFRDALALNPRHPAARLALAALLLDQNRFEEAQALLDEGLALEPERSAFRRMAARVDLARGQAGLALQRLEPSPPAVAADPEYHGLLASAYQRLNRHEDASRIYQSLMQLQPGEAHWWAGYGLSRDALGDAPGALAAYTQARQLGRLDPRVLEHINRRTAALQAAG